MPFPNVTNYSSNVRPGPNTQQINTVGNVTYTAQQVLGGLIKRDTNGLARSDVLPSAALLLAEMQKNGLPTDPGTCFDCLVVNEADALEVLTITAGVGITLIPASVTPTQNETATLHFTIDSATTMIVYARTTGA